MLFTCMPVSAQGSSGLNSHHSCNFNSTQNHSFNFLQNKNCPTQNKEKHLKCNPLFASAPSSESGLNQHHHHQHHHHHHHHHLPSAERNVFQQCNGSKESQSSPSFGGNACGRHYTNLNAGNIEKQTQNNAMKAPNVGKSTGQHSHCYAEVYIPTDQSKGLNHDKKTSHRPDHHHKGEANRNNNNDYSSNNNNKNNNETTSHKSFTINLKPGQYQVNLHLRSNSKPFHITLNTTSKCKSEERGTPPKEQQPLFYTGPSATSSSPVSLPRRIVDRIIQSSSPSGTHSKNATSGSTFYLDAFQSDTSQPIVTEIKVDKNPLRHLQNETRQRQKKGKYRWASLSCVHINSLDDSVSESSGSDTFGGYEGVEHLKRSTLGPNLSNCNNTSSLNVNTYINNSNNNSGFSQPTSSCMRFNEYDAEIARVSIHNEFCNVKDKGTSIFVEKPSVPFHSVSCDALINHRKEDSRIGDTSFKSPVLAPNERRTWHEDEAFFRQVVDEYFRETPISDTEDTLVTESETPTYIDTDEDNLVKCSQLTINGNNNDTKEVGGTFLTGRGPLPLAPKLISSCRIKKANSFLETIKEVRKDSFKNVAKLKINKTTVDEESFWEPDETASCYTDDSLGYEADVEPSDKETYGMVFWREWRSAPDVSWDKIRFPSNLKIKTGSRNDRTLDNNARAGSNRNRRNTFQRDSAFGYAPQTSRSSGVEKLSSFFVGVEKVRAHKLKQFFDDVYNESKKSTIRKIDKLFDTNKYSCSDENILGDCFNSRNHTKKNQKESSPRDINNIEINKSFSYENIENQDNSSYVNFYQNQQSVKENYDPYIYNGYFNEDDKNSDLAERALSEGLIITRTNIEKEEDYITCFASSSEQSEGTKNSSSIFPPIFHSVHDENLASLRSSEDLTLLAQEHPITSEEILYQSKLFDDSIHSKINGCNNCDNAYLDAHSSYCVDKVYEKVHPKMFSKSFLHYKTDLKWKNNNVDSFAPSACSNTNGLEGGVIWPEIEIRSSSKSPVNKCAVNSRPYISHRTRDRISSLSVDGRPPIMPVSRNSKSIDVKDFGSLGRVQVRSNNAPKFAKKKERSDSNVSLAQATSHSPIAYSPPPGQVSRPPSQVRGASRSKFLPNRVNYKNVTENIMGNVQAGEINNLSVVEEKIPNTDKYVRKKNSRKVKSRKYFNGFLESFGASGALAKNSCPYTPATNKEKLKSFVSNKSSASQNINERSYIQANKIKCDKYIRKQNCFTTDLSDSVQPTGSQTDGSRNGANNVANSSKKTSEVRNKNVDKHFEFLSHSSPIFDCGEGGHGIKQIYSSSKSPTSLATSQQNISESSYGVTEQNADHTHIYENTLFHKHHHYVGKFSYINSLIQSCEPEYESSTASGIDQSIHTLQSDSTFHALPTASTSLPDHYEEKKGDCESKVFCLPLQLQSNKKSENKFSSEPETNFGIKNEAIEESESVKDPACHSLVPEDEKDSDEETSESSSGKFSVCHSLSESVASDASSFYYTAAGGSAIYEALDAVTEYFSTVDKGLENSNTNNNVEGFEFLSDNSPSIKTDDIQQELGGKIPYSSSSSEKNDDLDDLTCLDSSIHEFLSNSDANNTNESFSSVCHEYVNANVLVKENEIIVTINPSEESVYSDPNVDRKVYENVGQSNLNCESVSGCSACTCVTSEVYSSPCAVLSNINVEQKVTKADDFKTSYPEKEDEDDEMSENEISTKKQVSRNGENISEFVSPGNKLTCSETGGIKSSTTDDCNGVVFASPCWVSPDNDTKKATLPGLLDSNVNDTAVLKKKFKKHSSPVEDDFVVKESRIEILIPKVAELMHANLSANYTNENDTNSNTVEEDLTVPSSSSIYTSTTFSETSENQISNDQGTSLEEESRLTPDEYLNSFSSTEYPSDEFSSSRDFERSSNCQDPIDPWAFHRMVWEHHQQTHQYLVREHFQDQHSSFKFHSPETTEKIEKQLVKESTPSTSLGLISSSLIDAKKPPRSPSHHSRDSSSMPREGRNRFNMRRRCRSFSSCSGETAKEESSPPRPRPTSLFALPKGSFSSQESLLDLPPRFSPARGDRAPDARWLAERKKAEGNESYKNKEYRDAIKLYSEAIELCPDCAAYYSNRSACHMMLGKYAQALADAREAVRLDPSFVKGYTRVAKCNVALGDANAALSILRQATELDPNNKAIRDEAANAQALIKCVEEVEKATSRKDFRMAIFHLDRALNFAAGCRSLKITKAEYLVYLQRYSDAQEIVNEILQFDNSNVDAIYVRGMCLYYQDNHDAAFTHFQHVLKLAPDHKKAKEVYKKAKLLKQKKEEGNQAFNKGQLKEALNIYSEAVAIDANNHATNSKLYCNRATVKAKLGKLEEAVDDCTAAINLNEGYVKAYLRRAKCYQDLEKHDEAVRDYEKVFKLDRNQEHKRLLHEAKLQLKKSKRKDYYKILGVSKTASEDEIKKSYRKMALQHHPDRHANASEKEKQEHEIKFKEIGEAYTVLTDAKKKSMYDRGQDINDMDGGFAHDDVDPNQIFQAFFSQGGSNQFGFGHPGGFGGFQNAGFSGGNFPGGFHFQFS